jgi:hypothetical protein
MCYEKKIAYFKSQRNTLNQWASQRRESILPGVKMGREREWRKNDESRSRNDDDIVRDTITVRSGEHNEISWQNSANIFAAVA